MTFPLQEPPFCIQIETCEGCNLSCSFCGIHGIRKTGTPEYRTFKFMTAETALKIANSLREAGWNPRIEFAMHGEPTLNPMLPDIVRHFRRTLPKISLMCTSNGISFIQDFEGRFLPAEIAREAAWRRINELFDAGLNCLGIDNYAYLHDRVATQLRALRTGFENNGIKFYEYPVESTDGNPNLRRRPNEKVLTIISEITQTKKGTHSTSHLGNHCGSAGPLADTLAGRACARPFREIDFRWDGSVALCCNDWRGEYVVGNIHNNTIQELWQSERFNVMRARLLRGQRDVRPCQGCTHRSFREGLLPDHKGAEKSNYPQPQDGDLIIINDALADGPLTKPVLRPWEIETP